MTNSSAVSCQQLAPGVFHFESLLSEKECQSIIEHGEELKYKQVPPTGGRQLVWSGTEASDVRNNQRIILEATDFSKNWAAVIQKRIEKFLPKNLEFRFNILPKEVNQADVCPTVEKAMDWTFSSVSDKFRMYKYDKKVRIV